jgi:anti-sigma-K factor RskA
MTGYDDEQKDLVALYAMNALDDLDRVTAERILVSSPEAARDLNRYANALAAMIDSAASLDPPARCWDQISTTIRRTAQAPPAARSIPRPKRRWPVADGRVLAVAATVVIAVLAAFTLRSLTDSGTNARARMTAALTRQGTHTGTVDSTTGNASIALEADGTGWVDVAALPDPGVGNVYQLWSLDSGAPVSLGVLHPSGGVARFTAPTASRTLAISKEKAPRAAQRPTLPPVGVAQLN